MSTSRYGPIKFSELQSRYGGSTPASLSEYRIGAGQVDSGIFVEDGPWGTGYFGGGTEFGSIFSGAIDGIRFSDNSAVNPSASLSLPREVPAAVSSNTRGYWAGGTAATGPLVPPSSEIDGIQFSNETAINPAATLTVSRYGATGVQSATRGYFGGGNTTTNLVSEIDGIQFSNETAINPSATLFEARREAAGNSSSSKGYFSGGTLGAGTTRSTTIDAITFINETVAVVTTNLTPGIKDHSGGVSSNIRGYWAGGYNGSLNINTISALYFSNETYENFASTLRLNTYVLDGAGVNSSKNGYFGGGNQGTSVLLSTIEGMQFDNHLMISTGASLSVARYSLAGVSWRSSVLPSDFNYHGRGYFGGGKSGAPTTTEIDGIKLTDETAINPSATLAVARSNHGGVRSSIRGYWLGGDLGSGGGYSNEIDGIQFSNETAINPSTNLSSAQGYWAGVSSRLKGYLGGGEPNYSIVTAFRFENETPSTLGTSLPFTRTRLASVGSESRGYFAGGINASLATYYPSIDALRYGDETLFALSTTLAVSRAWHAGVNSATRGYFGGGYAGIYGVSTEIDGIQFSDETAINPSATLAVARYTLGAVSSNTRGYFGGGDINTGVSSEIDGIQFSDETAINPSATLSVAREGPVGVENNPKSTLDYITPRGYFAGGIQTYGGNDPTTVIDSLEFINESAITPSATLSSTKHGGGGVNSTTRGYFGGGQGLTEVSNRIDGIIFFNETGISLSATLSVARYYLPGVSSSTKGYFGGGGTGFGLSTEIDGINFSDETIINPAATLSTARIGLGGVSSSSRGYFGGGSLGGSNSNEIDGIQFSDETAINPAATLLVARYGLAGVQSLSRGYFGGGTGPSLFLNEIDGIQFSNETAINPGATLALARTELGGVQSTLRGYWAGGGAGSSFPFSTTNEIDGIDFDSETALNPSATLSVPRMWVSGVSYNSSRLKITNTGGRGYFAGGNVESSNVVSTVIDGIQFSNETGINPSAKLSIFRYGLAGVNSPTRGYWAGGFTLYRNIMQIDGIRFSDETENNPLATLSLARYNLGGVNSDTKGYFGGGLIGSNYTSEIDGIQFSGETAINPSATLATARSSLAGVQSATRGYFAGGIGGGGGPYSNEIDGIQFSDETAINPSVTLTIGRQTVGLSSDTRGHFATGAGFGYHYRIDGINFSDETSVTFRNGLARVTQTRVRHAGVSGSVRGYIAGGKNVTSEQEKGSGDIEGFQYSDEASINPSARLETPRLDLAGVSNRTTSSFPLSLSSYRGYNSYRGYWAGGSGGGFSFLSEIDGIQFTSETAINPLVALTPTREASAGVSSSVKGYFGGGYDGWQLARIDGLEFATESLTNTSASLSLARTGLAGVNSSIRGYWGGGFTATGVTSEIDGIQFSDETAINPSAVLEVARTGLAGVNAPNVGLFGGGDIGGSVNTTEIDGIKFADETQETALSRTLAVARRGVAGVSSGDTGYWAGGYTTGVVSEIDAYMILEYTSYNPSVALSLARVYATGVSSATRGYIGGGFGTAMTTVIDGLDFSNETAINPSATLAVARSLTAGIQSGRGSRVYLPFINFTASPLSGFSPLTVNFTDNTTGTPTGWAWDFQNNGSTDSSSQNPSFTYSSVGTYTVKLTVTNSVGSKSIIKYDTVVINTPSSKGFWAGGRNLSGTYYASIEGLRFSNNSTFNTSVALSVARAGRPGSVSSTTKGYVAGGLTVGSNRSAEIDGIDFLTETAINPSVSLATARSNPAGVQSSTRGYFGGGFNDFGETGFIDGIEFSSEIYINVVATLALARTGHTGVYSSTKGYFGGGSVGGVLQSEIDGIQFSGETAINPANGLVSSRVALSGLSSSLIGYFGGGSIAGTPQTEIDGIRFSDEATVNPSAALFMGARYSLASVTTYTSKGYWGGGQTASSAQSAVDEINFSTETVSNPVAPLSVDRTELAGVQSPVGSPPVAEFAANVFAGNAPLTINFTDYSTGSPDNWAWDFENNGSTDSTSQNPSYTYTSAGNYSVKLTVTNIAGSGTIIKTAYITVYATPVANFTGSPLALTESGTVNFTDSSTNSPTSWAWDFQNNGSTDSSIQNPSFTYSSPGFYSVKLVATNPAGSNTLIRTDYVKVYPSVLPVEILIVGGGGGGAGGNGATGTGGGGAGAYRSISINLTASDFPQNNHYVYIGAGGDAGGNTLPGTNGGSGTYSYFYAANLSTYYYAYGGGGGGSNGAGVNGQNYGGSNPGSGGGGGQNDGGAGTGGLGEYNGGQGAGATHYWSGGGGGGGILGNGINGEGGTTYPGYGNGGEGGYGRDINFWHPSPPFGSPFINYWIGKGGGGGSGGAAGNPTYVAKSGRGQDPASNDGNGGSNYQNVYPQNGRANTGNGGGGGWGGANELGRGASLGAVGGSGLIVIRYPIYYDTFFYVSNVDYSYSDSNYHYRYVTSSKYIYVYKK